MKGFVVCFLYSLLCVALFPLSADAGTGFGDLVIHCPNGNVHLPEDEYEMYYSGYSIEEFCSIFSPYVSDFGTELVPLIQPPAVPAQGDEVPIAEEMPYEYLEYPEEILLGEYEFSVYEVPFATE